jgi:hypothetical protein
MNSTIQALPPLLDFLQDLMPPSHITLVGAGNGKGRWAQWLSALKLPSTLVEADEQQFAALQHLQAAGSFAQARLLHAVAAAEAVEVKFYTSSLAAESGLLSGEAVQQLWPNVHQLQANQRQATGFADLLPSQANQWLVLDCLPAAALLHSAVSTLTQVDVVLARVLLTANHAHPIPGTGLEELAGLLPDFVQLALQPTRHPAIAYALLVRDYRRATAQALKAHASESQAKQAAIQAQQTLQAQLQQAAQQNADLLKKQELHAQAQQGLQKNLTEITQANDTRQVAQSPLSLNESIETLTEELKKQNVELSEKITKQNNDLIKVRKQLESTFKQEMLNATQQLEAFLNIQSFFTHGEHQPIMHGWPISPDFALYLIGLLEKNDYDLILEFGSGTSTVIMAKALARLNNGRRKPSVEQVAFEHLEQYRTQTLNDLQAAGMVEAVEVVLASLQPYRAPNGTTYSYYACQEKLAELASSKQGLNRKILVVVDGPPGSTGKHARYPALPAVLSHFKTSSIDFVLDDYFREDEKEVANLWIKDCEIAGLIVKTDSIKMEKDAFFISIQPQ